MDKDDPVDTIDNNNAYALPSAGRSDRWQPLRSGMLNLYRYTRQEFWYEHGHLLLRGNNGTGKSRVLALQLPFLLDGEIASRRVEPDADPAKRMEWNVLMDVHDNRTGYTWIEFGQQTDEGERFVTLGCGLHATKGGNLKRWFFVTSQRVGQDLFLETAAGTPLTREACRDALGDAGMLYTKVGEYRRAVDDQLFHLGEERYGALIDLLIQLRQPQLSRQLDERRLSDALSNSLPPLQPSVLHDVANSFRALEEDRQSLDNYKAAVDAVSSFRKTYRRYARSVAGKRSEALRSTHSHYEQTQRNLRETEQSRLESEQSYEAAKTRTRTRGLSLEAHRAESDALRTSPAMKQAEQLDRLGRDRHDAEQRLERATRDLNQQVDERDARRGQHDETQQHADKESHNTEAALSDVRDAAEVIGIADRVLRIVVEDQKQQKIQGPLKALADHIDQSLRHLRGMQQKITEAKADERRAADLEQQQHARFDRVQDEAETCRSQRQAAVDAYLEASANWSAALTLLTIPELNSVLEQTAIWTESLTPPQPLDAAAQKAYNTGSNELVRRRLLLEEERNSIRELDTELSAEAQRLEAGDDRIPAAPHTRDGACREGRPGAPLWQLCDFRDSVPTAQRGPLEAALEASGLLDAWVMPEGTLLGKNALAPDGDALLTPDAPACEEATSLLQLLKADMPPQPDAADALNVDIVENLLSRIAITPGDHHTIVTTDGYWKQGLRHGRWQKETPEYVGASAREQARQRRLEEIKSERDFLRNEDSRCTQGLQALTEEESVRQAEYDALPSAQPILTGDQNSRRADACVADEREELLLLTERRQESRQIFDNAQSTYHQAAADLKLEAWTSNLDGLADASRALSTTLSTLSLAMERQQAARRQAASAAEELSRAEARLVECQTLQHEAEVESTRRNREFETLSQTAGQAARDIKERLDAVTERIAEATQALETAREDEATARDALVRCREREDNARERLREADETRTLEHQSFCEFVATSIIQEADLALPEPPNPAKAFDLAVSPAVELARELDRQLPETVSWSEDTRDRIQNELQQRFQDLQTTLTAHHYSPVSESHHDITIVTCPYQGQRRSMHELGRCLEDEVNQRRQLLAANEREFIENYLIGEIAHHLHHQIHSADTFVADMNAELDKHPMSTGMRLRFVWAPRSDGPPGLPEARRLLAQSQEILSPDDRNMLAGFLQARIREVDEEGEAMGWGERLERAVDYRRWHSFGVERHQAGRWQRLTKRTHGTGSGGEKAIALTIPQFAAAAAHYHNIPHAPRLIMLDEAFVGIDSDMRAKCMDLLHQFDLDLVMTSEREWGCYPSVRGMAIYQLATRPGIDAIAVTRWVWNGKHKLQRNTPPPAKPREPAPETAADQTDLFN
jgi:uncharacterized protein (TIGR02680 family)